MASPLEPERIRRTFGELEQLLRARQAARPATARRRRAASDGYGEVFLVIDNLYAFSRDNTDTFNTRNPLLAKVTELVNTGLSYGIHVVITTPNWLEVPLAMRDGLGLRLELKLRDSQDSNVRVVGALRRPAEAVPADQPGRGLTMAAEHFLFAEPSLRDIAVDQRPLPGRRGAAGAAAADRPGPRVRWRRCIPAPERVVIGQREEDLAAVVVDFADNPLLMVFGDAKSGKTTLLRHLIRTIRENSTPDRVAFTVIDRRLHLVDEPLFADNEYTPNIDRITPAMLGLSALIEKRRPPAGLTPQQLSGWTYQSGADGHTHYLIIDDVDQIPDAPAVSGPYRRAAAVDRTDRAAVAGQPNSGCASSSPRGPTGSAHAVMTAPLLRRLNELQADDVMLSGNPQDSGKIRGSPVPPAAGGPRACCSTTAMPRRSCNWSIRSPTQCTAVRQHRQSEEGSSTDDSASSSRRPGRGQCRRRGADRAAGRRPRRGRTPDHRRHAARRRPGVAADRCGFSAQGAEHNTVAAQGVEELGRSGVGVGESGTSYATGDAVAASSYLIAGS